MILRKFLLRKDLYNVAIATVRYFGGILLGTGGLVHAYSQGASLAVEAAGVARLETYSVIEAECSYSDHQRIAFELERCDAIIDATDYSDCVKVTFAVKKEFEAEIMRKITDLSSGRASSKKLLERFDAK